MTFSSITFFIFFIVVLVLMLLLQSKRLITKFGQINMRKARHLSLLASSYVFYGWWDWRFCFLMFFMTFVSYICAKKQEKKIARVIAVVIPLVTLGIFKYFNFFVDSFLTLFGMERAGVFNIILPVGISFYTFQSMSYTIDVFRGEKSQSFLNVALYVSFFPQLVAGPIVKANEFLPQLEEERVVKWKGFLDGVQIFAFGLFKKIVIADHLSIFVEDVFGNPAAFSSVSVILAVISYSIQIYFDFSGYSDMAIGTAKCLGYDLSRNFNMPYLSKNVSEFWKRWHISLSSWLQQYLYIPLGGNRKGTGRTYWNLMVTMILGGLWHGANVTFIVWGFLHGAALCIHKLYQKYIRKGNKGRLPGKVLSVVVTYVFVCICWVFFRAETVSDALVVLQKMFCWSNGITQPFFWTIVAIFVVVISHIVAILVSKHNGAKNIDGFYPVLDLTKMWCMIVFFVFVGLILGTAYTGANPFIYFQF